MSQVQGEQALSNRLQKLDLETSKPAASSRNPFIMHRRRSKSLSSINFGASCDCYKKQPVKHTTSFKKTPPGRKLLREPVLKWAKCPHSEKVNAKIAKKRKEKLFGQCSRHKERDFRSIVDACEQLSLNSDSASPPATSSSSSATTKCYSSASFLKARSHSSSSLAAPPQRPSDALGASCSHQARMNHTPPCDVTIDELASYFETFVHIPKKMSSMAEMMYI